jgi:signal transduction histidine kinase
VRVALTLRSRLTLATLAATLVGATLLVVGLQLLLARQSDAESRGVLQARIAAATGTVEFTPQGARVLETPSRVLDQELWVYDASGRRIDGARPPVLLRATVGRLSTATRARDVVVGDYRVGARPVRMDGTGRIGAVVVGALDLTPYENSGHRTLWISTVLGALIVLAATAAAWLAAGSSLHHVRQMARRADEWREHDPSGRFALGPPDDELTELARTLDRMLDRIEQALRAERRLTDEVAHELRTPLAVVRAEAELALLRTDDHAAVEAALREILAGADRMNASITTMLAAARSRHAGDETCQVAEALERVVLDAHAEGVTVELDAVALDLEVAAPASIVVAAVSPLVDNAVRHARSRVRLSAARRDGRVVVAVADDGPGLAEDAVGAVFEPGFTTRQEGTGLGLPVARRMARSIGGDVTAVAGPGGRFELSLPVG